MLFQCSRVKGPILRECTDAEGEGDVTSSTGHAQSIRESLIQLDYIPLFPAWIVTNHMTVRTQEDVQNNNVFLRHLS